MEDNIGRIINGTRTLKDLLQFEKNAQNKGALTPEVKSAIDRRAAEFGRMEIVERTGLDLSELSPAEEKIVRAASEYVALKKRSGSNANRTINQIRDQGLIDSAEISVSKVKPTKGFEDLAEADLSELSYEQIIIDHDDEFSPRALWYARQRLGLSNDSEKPPAKAVTPVQKRTEILLQWLRNRSESNSGIIPTFTNAEAASILDMGNMHRFGRVFGNIQSRIDYACYALGLPPLGLTAENPFDKAWNQQDRNWAFPITLMKEAAQSRYWSAKDFDRILQQTEKLPGQAYISWKRALSQDETAIKNWAFGLQVSGASSVLEDEVESKSQRNPAWSRAELILALDLYLRFQSNPPAAEIAELSAILREMGRKNGLIISSTYRNTNGVGMKLSNFRRLDPQYIAEGKVGLSRGSDGEEVIWGEFYNNPQELNAAARLIRAEISDMPESMGMEELETASSLETPYWVFVCNPKKWAIDRFLEQDIKHDSWGVRSSDRDKFAPGQLGIVRVGVDTRNKAELNGRERLEAGIYALCEVESYAYDGTGASDEFWTPGEEHEPGRPTVKIRYLQTYKYNPLSIERLRQERPSLSAHLLKGLQASCFPLPAKDFHEVITLLGTELDDLPLVMEGPEITKNRLSELETRYQNASPEVKEKLSKTIERGPIGNEVKKAIGYKCQLCEALGLNPVGFLKPNGVPYVEAHHVRPVAEKMIGSLSASNIMLLCANHHRQIHYGGIEVRITPTDFEFDIESVSLSIPRYLPKE